ncbi:MAG: group I intron-associated PD-(D/E)XK endonuclease [Patescibacteria group bacterium]
MSEENKEWARNLTKTDDGIFRTINGSADELIGIGRTIKAGFNCSRVDIPNGRYDAIVDVGAGVMLRIQIKGVGKNKNGKLGSVSFTGGSRSGKQINREVESRTYKYTAKDIDILMAVDSTNGECYIVPVKDLKKWGTGKALSTLQDYKENWDILIKIANEKKRKNN